MEYKSSRENNKIFNDKVCVSYVSATLLGRVFRFELAVEFSELRAVISSKLF